MILDLIHQGAIEILAQKRADCSIRLFQFELERLNKSRSIMEVVKF